MRMLTLVSRPSPPVHRLRSRLSRPRTVSLGHRLGILHDSGGVVGTALGKLETELLPLLLYFHLVAKV